MSTIFVRKPWVRRALAGILVLVVLAPLFAWVSGVVGYSEPLTNAAIQTGAADDERTINPGLFPDYTIPGLDTGLGTLGSALVGTVITLLIALGLGRILN